MSEEAELDIVGLVSELRGHAVTSFSVGFSRLFGCCLKGEYGVEESGKAFETLNEALLNKFGPASQIEALLIVDRALSGEYGEHAKTRAADSLRTAFHALFGSRSAHDAVGLLERIILREFGKEVQRELSGLLERALDDCFGQDVRNAVRELVERSLENPVSDDGRLSPIVSMLVGIFTEEKHFFKSDAERLLSGAVNHPLLGGLVFDEVASRILGGKLGTEKLITWLESIEPRLNAKTRETAAYAASNAYERWAVGPLPRTAEIDEKRGVLFRALASQIAASRQPVPFMRELVARTRAARTQAARAPAATVAR